MAVGRELGMEARVVGAMGAAAVRAVALGQQQVALCPQCLNLAGLKVERSLDQVLVPCGVMPSTGLMIWWQRCWTRGS